jgi:hypothetical protein
MGQKPLGHSSEHDSGYPTLRGAPSRSCPSTHGSRSALSARLPARASRLGIPKFNSKWAILRQRSGGQSDLTNGARRWPLGSGIVESLCRLVSNLRTKEPGMYWSDRDVQELLMLRALRLSFPDLFCNPVS